MKVSQVWGNPNLIRVRVRNSPGVDLGTPGIFMC